MSEEKRKVIGVLKSLIEFLEEEPGESPHPSPAATPSVGCRPACAENDPLDHFPGARPTSRGRLLEK